MSVKTCKQHANEPIFIYAQCAACEIQRYRNQVDELKAECARSTEREILQLAESEALRKALADILDLYDTDEGCRSLPQYINGRAALGQGEQS